jgi:hypothetical protein
MMFDRWSASLAPEVALLPGLPVYDSRLFGALRDSYLGSGQKEQAGEEALYWESSVFRYGRAAQRVVLSDRCYPFRRQSYPRPFYGTVARVRLCRSKQ